MTNIAKTDPERYEALILGQDIGPWGQFAGMMIAVYDRYRLIENVARELMADYEGNPDVVSSEREALFDRLFEALNS